MDIIIGATISIIGTFLFNFWLSRRSESKRWDADRLRTLTEARVNYQRALGRIEAMAAKHIEVKERRKRPDVIERFVDSAWYSLEELAILYPTVKNDIHALQLALVTRLEFAFDSLEQEDSHGHYKAHLSPDEKYLGDLQEKVLLECQMKVGIK